MADQADRKKNTDRGLRCIAAIERRREERSVKRWAQRRAHRKGKINMDTPRPRGEAQEPTYKPQPTLEYTRHLKIATLNLRGLMQPGKREEVERWMKKDHINIVCAQETHTSTNQKEKRKDYPWYFSGNDKGERDYAGVAIIIDNSLAKYIRDVTPHSNRASELSLEGSVPITIIGAYAPQAGRPQHEKENFYEQLRSIIKKINKKGPYILAGDWNAKIQEPGNEEETQ